MSGDGRERERELLAWLDGELGPWARRRAARRAERDPRARAEVRFWRDVGALLREEAEETPTPDLWPALRARLPAAPTAATAPLRAPGGRRPLAAWLGGAAAAAAAALALAIGLSGGDAGPGPASVRWLDTEGKPAMVLQDDREATIIWLLEGAGEQSARRTPRAVA